MNWDGVCVLYWKGQWRFLGIGKGQLVGSDVRSATICRACVNLCLVCDFWKGYMELWWGKMVWMEVTWGCDRLWEVLETPRAFQSSPLSPLVDLATVAQFWSVLHGLLSFLSHFPSHQCAQLNSTLLLQILPLWTQQQRAVEAGRGSTLWACAPLTHLHSLAIGNIDSLLPRTLLYVFRPVPGWFIHSYSRIFHSKLGTVFHKTVCHFRFL